jgi:hypothetical protein
MQKLFRIKSNQRLIINYNACVDLRIKYIMITQNDMIIPTLDENIKLYDKHVMNFRNML